MFAVLYKKAGLDSGIKNLIRPALAGLAMGLVVYWFRGFSIFIPFSSGLAVYFSTLYLIRGFTKSDLKEIFQRV